jgi:2-isopropylmalate synthase
MLDEVKELEATGYAYEGADASFELLAWRILGKVPDYFTVEKFDVTVEHWIGKRSASTSRSRSRSSRPRSTATLMMAAEGIGPSMLWT